MASIDESYDSHNFAMFLNTLTPKFYVALTGTSSLISGLILIFEWWYFKRYGTSFIEQMSLTHVAPWLGGDVVADDQSAAGGSGSEAEGSGFGGGGGGNALPAPALQECKVWRNPLNLLRGSEYNRYTWVTGRDPLTYYDMNLSAQDHQTYFTCDSDVSSNTRPGDKLMYSAWREVSQDVRIKTAHDALTQQPDCVTAQILLAEEEAITILDSEKLFKDALSSAEQNLKKSSLYAHTAEYEAINRRDLNVLVYVKRRLGMCARKLGKTKEAAKMFKDLMKEHPSILNIHENYIDCLLELSNYSDCLSILTKYDDISLPKSATICYTSALLKSRQVADKFSPEVASKRGLNGNELQAVDAIHRAVEFNPHVPKYLLETKALILPPEHILKRGDSEAIAYAFFHLRHWKRVEGALNLLHCTWEGTFRVIPYPLEKGHLFYPYPSCTETADRELLPSFHALSVYPKKELPFFIVFTAGLCTITAALAFLTHQYPQNMGAAASVFFSAIASPFSYIAMKLEPLFPTCLLQFKMV